MNIAVIPARGGSKRIPRKNIRSFSGKPMIAYAIEAAKDCGLFSHVVVSTDDPEIAAIACQYGADIPFVRPTELADDHTPTVPVIAHAIAACESFGWHSEMVCCIYPGVPFIQTEDIQAAMALLQVTPEADYCFPVTEFSSAIQRALRRDATGQLQSFFPEFELVRTQDLDPAYHDAGQFYWGRRRAWLDNPYIHGSGVGLVIPGWRVVDIDTPDDWQRAEMMHKSLHGSSCAS
ncbi:pseudaminic acid cytidylyltransferase [Laribacter hongkongensis]|uniref:pseudaminic acid cytidylyltransferase n=1 Tax=Laribacter hongkongensis TaxID=168471 RepID=UPI001EFD47E0|nr:pseudaminic acid cytidylyltransferase [Laribacter hongkongensis]MCG8993028.1 pseudaminic acid cytidylyltransferase [Laribacter hongkongensis]MCG8998774.1 pseudaminic acid cytidylyltransferase [Laribacter hongkongensis]MCG9002116.1 pseudaminic acid cytidylyltransferase [Laribacter hongkongensis]MCG9005299.1 pseudaminic acid cytidylyltransferase [Laribacter hongkongensis]MCG9007813.1 pseudaminic acid cytidylyltransferase [Laribacter hongkongensis]